MPYVLRDESGKIQRISVRALASGEILPHNDPTVIEFLKANEQNPSEVEETLVELRITDIDMTRTIEDLIMVLLKKNIIKMSDLPRVVQDRMAHRVKLRSRIEDIYEKASRTYNPNLP